MKRQRVIAVGSYPEWDNEAMTQSFSLTTVARLADLADLDPSLRHETIAVAYKGGAAFGAETMDLLPALGVIANFGVGYDAIDVDAARARGIRVTNTPDVLNDDVADTALAMMLALCRRIPDGDRFVREGRWPKEDFPLNRKFSGGRAGIMGLGRIGRAIADRLVGFGMEIHYHSRSAKEVPAGWIFHATPEGLAAEVDWLVVALVGGAATERYVSAEVIACMPQDAVLVNISRGTTVDEAALIEALEAGRIGAALDVFRNEPDIDPRFLSLPNVLLQPHQGSGTVETRRAMGELQRANIRAFLTGEPLLTPVA
ncbi:2-hydroxyacid dehydrogenase [Cereibacter azotoformans]|uniref:2-hydroxyacid dehydrogenase n=1 Tax=Cereibacter azotoformans TaxID=43057 RepID=UPI000E359999|nr:2-hydroxyacid dehydrogenase [Cereibacter azotoformans]AXQ93499.1 2-hydroxyacid dehydrogenase [Cereibacter sphaeroides]UIJ31835.1 2-hydroxyacid dehydrogenase [Cereibacter azotoformans]